MILLWGVIEDPPMNMVFKRLKEIGAPVFFLNHADIGETELYINFLDEPAGYIEVYNQTIDFKKVTAAYMRPYNFKFFPEFRALLPDDDLLNEISLRESMLWSWAELTNKLIINKPSSSASNFSKPFQTELIKRAGFKIPDTLITTDISALQQFLKVHKTIIYKSISNIRSIVKTIRINQAIDLTAIENCPVQFQEWIDGTDYRVHVIGEEVFACKIVSEGVDYRYSNAIVEAAKLPEDIAEQCVILTKILGLNLSGIDLRLSKENVWYCFEVNPSPAFSYYELQSGLAVSQAIAEYLINQ